MMGEVYIISAVRTPIGKFGGVLAGLSPSDLGAHAMRGALDKGDVSGEQLDLYIFGNVLRAGHGQLIPRQAALKAGIPSNIDGFAVDMVCSSGMMSIINATAILRSGDAGLVLAGGTESMSNAGFYLSSRARWGYKLLTGDGEPVTDLLIYDGLTDPMRGEIMGKQSERLAAEYSISREELDEVAAASHQRAAEATENGSFSSEIIPVEMEDRGHRKVLDRDEGIRADTTPEKLGGLKPAFEANGVLTAGNSSQISDGASAILLADERSVERHNLKPIARVIGGTWTAGETWRFPEAPIPAVKKLIDRIEMGLDAFDLFENNEAFALNNVLFSRMLDVPVDKLNIHGGAIALGHPIGASGARIVTTLIHALHKTEGRYGLAAICHGTGGSTALAVEKL